MRVRLLSARDKETLAPFLTLKSHELAAYAFENIYIWKALYQISWVVLKDALCIFFKDKVGCFLYLPPLADGFEGAVLREAFAIMDSSNTNTRLSRIENIEAQDIEFFRRAGYECSEKFPDYLCARSEVAQLAGNALKSQRASYNHFKKHNDFEYLPYSVSCKDECVGLYRRWMETYKSVNRDPIYQGMLKDSFAALKILLDDYAALGATGRLIRIGKELKAFTFGFGVSEETFCVLFEVADLSIKGISQYIFSKFCEDLKAFTFINIMDDSGLENLRRVKLSYRPLKTAASFIALRK